jgi:hypothetical protein
MEGACSKHEENEKFLQVVGGREVRDRLKAIGLD